MQFFFLTWLNSRILERLSTHRTINWWQIIKRAATSTLILCKYVHVHDGYVVDSEGVFEYTLMIISFNIPNTNLTINFTARFTGYLWWSDQAVTDWALKIINHLFLTFAFNIKIRLIEYYVHNLNLILPFTLKIHQYLVKLLCVYVEHWCQKNFFIVFDFFNSILLSNLFRFK